MNCVFLMKAKNRCSISIGKKGGFKTLLKHFLKFPKIKMFFEYVALI